MFALLLSPDVEYRVCPMADVPLSLLEVRLLKDVGDVALLLAAAESVGRGRHDPGRFLAAVLERVEPKVRQAC